ncbi:SDR family NAD(P)-dependent oxidoreductase [Streptomyces flavalbus]|uniref:SDR family NAD(P)-dependent oxidoreductase n=1 Tax=Streptomyces flavalbus TaxID=2665155 RepID=A0ABW2VZW1_9ACTN
MADKTIVLTGATSGIGEASAPRFAATADRLIVHGPEPEESVLRLLRRLSAAGNADVHYVQADFDDLSGVVRLADRVRDLTDRVDVLVNNAGRPGAERRQISGNGYEVTLQTNYLAAVLLTDRLAPLLPPRTGRVVHVASATHLSVTLDLDDIQSEHGYSPFRAYARSKLAMVGHALWQADQWGSTGPQIVSISPGVIDTGLLHAMFAVRGAAPSHGAANVIDASTLPLPHSGAYIDDGRPAQPHPDVLNAEFRKRLHAVTAGLLSPWEAVADERPAGRPVGR